MTTLTSGSAMLERSSRDAADDTPDDTADAAVVTPDDTADAAVVTPVVTAVSTTLALLAS